MKNLFQNIVVTGFSAITAAGNDLDHLRRAVASGESALTPIPAEILNCNCVMWGKAVHFKASDFIHPLKLRRLDRGSQLAIAAAGMALGDASVSMEKLDPERVGIALGCGFGGVANSAEFLTGYFENGVEGISPLLFPNTVSNAPASNASIEHGLKGPNITMVQRFCSAESAFLAACRFIEEGRADIMLTGGVDELTPLMVKAFKSMGQLKSYAASFGEGCGIVLLENEEHAARRGAVIRGRVNSVNSLGVASEEMDSREIGHLLSDSDGCCYFSLSGTADISAPLSSFVKGKKFIDMVPVVGRSLAMGGTVMAMLIDSLPQSARAMHIAASPEGPCYAISFSREPF